MKKKKNIAGKLYAYTDTKREALGHQKRLLKKGKVALIKKEFGGFSVMEVGRKLIVKPKKKKIISSIYTPTRNW